MAVSVAEGRMSGLENEIDGEGIGVFKTLLLFVGYRDSSLN